MIILFCLIYIGILPTFNMRKIQAFTKPHFCPLTMMGNSPNFNSSPKEFQCSIYMANMIKTLRLRLCSSIKWSRCNSSNRHRNSKDSTHNKTFSHALTQMSTSTVHNNIISITIHLIPPKKMSSNTQIDHRLELQQTSKSSNRAYR